jgi:integrase
VPILTDDEIAALLKTCAVGRGRPGVFDRTVFLGRRDEVVLRLLLDTGKGSRPRVVPFGAKTAQAVDRYLRVRALHPHARSPRLLLGQRGPMTPDGARDVLNARAAHRRLGLGNRL